MYLLTGSHDISSTNFTLITKPIVIGDGVWVATGSTVLPGITLSDMTVVGAGSVVIKSTEENDVVGGTPQSSLKKENSEMNKLNLTDRTCEIAREYMRVWGQRVTLQSPSPQE